MSQYTRIAKLIQRKRGATAMEITQDAGTVSAHRGALKWTPEEDALFIAEYPHCCNKELAQKFGRTLDAIWRHARVLGVRKTDAARFEAKSRGGKNNKKRHFPSIHGMAHPGNRTYASWVSMKARCLDTTHKSYADYGGRGVLVCDEWQSSFLAFFLCMGERPPNTTLGRIDNNGNYSPGNCEWQTMSEQQNNRRSSRFLEAFGRRQTMQQWADELGFPRDTIGKRLDQMGWSVEDALSRPVATRWKKAA